MVPAFFKDYLFGSSGMSAFHDLSVNSTFCFANNDRNCCIFERIDKFTITKFKWSLAIMC